MKTGLWAFPFTITLAGLLSAGCSTQHAQAHKPVFVAPWGVEPTVASPAPRENIIGAPPGSRLNWVDGYWAFTNWRWFWMPGHWEEQRPSSATWVPGHWDRRGGQWLWQPGHWATE